MSDASDYAALHAAYRKRRAEMIAELRNTAHTVIAEIKARETWDSAIIRHIGELIAGFDRLGALHPPEPHGAPAPSGADLVRDAVDDYPESPE